MTDKEKTLIAGCLKGEKAAWDAFVVQYSALVYHAIKSTCLSFHAVSDSSLAEDLYQEFFVSILRDDFKKLRQFRGDHDCSLASWLRVIATRLTVDFLRKREPTHTAAVERIASDQPDLPGDLIDGEKEELLLQAIQSLAPRDRFFLELCFRQDLRPQDIAGILKISVPAVYTQKSRILAKLRESLGKTFGP